MAGIFDRSLRGGNRCDGCGKFAPWEELTLGESPRLDVCGNVDMNYWTQHKEGCGCRAIPASSLANPPRLPSDDPFGRPLND